MGDFLTYETGSDKVKVFFADEFPLLKVEIVNNILRLIPRLLNYQEEGVRIRPKIIFCNCVDKIKKNIADCEAVNIFCDDNADSFHMRIKSLAALTTNDWLIYIEQKKDKFNYGLIKAINSIKDESFEKLLFNYDQFGEMDNIVFLRALSNTSIEMKSTTKNSFLLDFTLDRVWDISAPESYTDMFVNDTFSKLRTTKKKLMDIKVLYSNIFEKALTKIAGAICVIVDKDYVDSGFFDDGVWLTHPIEISKLFLQSKSYSEARLINYSNLFIDMLNYDGITIIDNTGRILAYNVFVESSCSKASNLIGGARKRAAYTIINTKRSKIMGVFFQSHDGEVFYSRVKANAKKEKVLKK